MKKKLRRKEGNVHNGLRTRRILPTLISRRLISGLVGVARLISRGLLHNHHGLLGSRPGGGGSHGSHHGSCHHAADNRAGDARASSVDDHHVAVAVVMMVMVMMLSHGSLLKRDEKCVPVCWFFW